MAEANSFNLMGSSNYPNGNSDPVIIPTMDTELISDPVEFIFTEKC